MHECALTVGCFGIDIIVMVRTVTNCPHFESFWSRFLSLFLNMHVYLGKIQNDSKRWLRNFHCLVLNSSFVSLHKNTWHSIQAGILFLLASMCDCWHLLGKKSVRVCGKQWRDFIHLFLFPGFSPVLTGPDAKKRWHFVMVHSGVMSSFVIEHMPFKSWIKPSFPFLRTHSNCTAEHGSCRFVRKNKKKLVK